MRREDKFKLVMPGDKQRTKKQHYVPRTYLKAWETKVETIEKPTEKFDGVYVFDRDKKVGDGRKRDSILWVKNIYTVYFDDIYFLYNACPKIRKYFSEKVYELMNGAERLYAKCGKYVLIKTERSVEKHLCEIDDWEFFNYFNDQVAGTKAIINQVHRLKCYLIEEAFDDYFENDWEQNRDSFIDAVKKSFYKSRMAGTGHSEKFPLYQIPMDRAEKMLSFSFMLLCRNPKFDLKGLCPAVKDKFLTPALVDGVDSLEIPEEDIEEIKKDNKKFIESLVKCLWISELYRIFFKKSKGFYNSLKRYAHGEYGGNGFQMILFERSAGSIPFITSDNPVNEYNNALTTTNYNAIYFPISPDYLLLITKGNEKINKVGYRMADVELVKHFNRIICSGKNEVVVVNQKNLPI